MLVGRQKLSLMLRHSAQGKVPIIGAKNLNSPLESRLTHHLHEYSDYRLVYDSYHYFIGMSYCDSTRRRCIIQHVWFLYDLKFISVSNLPYHSGTVFVSISTECLKHI